MSRECYGRAVRTDTDLERIEALPEEDRRLWIDTKLRQVETMAGDVHLPPMGREGMNAVLVDTMLNVDRKLDGFGVITCSVSGGSDSDAVMDLLARSSRRFREIRFKFFDTGIEYAATKRHLDEMEKKYGVTIERRRAVKSIPVCCREYGQPFLSKRVSEMIYYLQAKGFRWEDEPLEVLEARYPRARKYLRWWCNDWGPGSKFNIAYNKGLREFMIANPPTFRISPMCCTYAKKKVADQYDRETGADLAITGVRKAEGGARSYAYRTCLSVYDGDVSQFRPIFWWTDADKKAYAAAAGVTNSDCYAVYGMKRTGCAGCPFGRHLEQELEIIRVHEPKLYEVVNTVFGDSYEYTRAYREFVRGLKQ